MVLRFAAALPGARQELASTALSPLRSRKSAAEIAALRAAGQAIDRVHAQVPGWLRPGRTEQDVAADIGEAILAQGHSRADFAIVASGPNGASPHHTAGDRVLRAGDTVVVDIGGTMPSGYCSDCTRTYVIGEPPPAFAAYYQVLKDAQDAACAAVGPAPAPSRSTRRPGSRSRRPAYGQFFLHRTGHGIGLETHEDPYIVSGNTRAARAGARVLGRARHLPGQRRRQDRGHRRVHGHRLRTAQHGDARSRLRAGLMRAGERESRDETARALFELTAEIADNELRPAAAAAEREAPVPQGGVPAARTVRPARPALRRGVRRRRRSRMRPTCRSSRRSPGPG